SKPTDGKIVDLAERMIRLSGLEPGRDIEIKFIGIRPGERLHEILFAREEPSSPIGIEGIVAARPISPALEAMRGWLGARPRGRGPFGNRQRPARRRAGFRQIDCLKGWARYPARRSVLLPVESEGPAPMRTQVAGLFRYRPCHREHDRRSVQSCTPMNC